ncbi:MAG: hypothetical protein ACM3H8_10280 [Sphingobacteriales bacterium]
MKAIKLPKRIIILTVLLIGQVIVCGFRSDIPSNLKEYLEGSWQQNNDKSRYLVIKNNKIEHYNNCKLESTGILKYIFPENEKDFYDLKRKA